MKTFFNKYTLAAAAIIFAMSGCDDLFEPAIENNLGMEYMYDHPDYAEGILNNAYARLPNNATSFNDVATDDAVSNQSSNNYRKMADGAWASDNNPMDRWTNMRAGIQYANLFLENVDKVNWCEDEKAAELYRRRLTGEAYGIRAILTYYLLEAHSGFVGGTLYGIPIVTSSEDASTDFNYPRNTFKECIDAIYSDIDKAMELLPEEYVNIASDDQIPSKYSSIGADYEQYNRAMGVNFSGLLCGKILEAYQGKAALLAASPAYETAGAKTYADAANYFAKVLSRIGGVDGMDPIGNTWYNNAAQIKAMTGGACTPEMLWRDSKSTNSYSLEQDNLPPSIYGSGKVNPTQNLVDCFGDINGYPINNESAVYSASDPYKGRDPRLDLYIIHHGSKFGSSTITTDGSNNDALNKESGRSTRTGYYMKKHLRSDVVLTSTSQTGQDHYSPRVRYTEMFLSYAEAANEAFGPLTAADGVTFTAYDVIKAIRQRAGIKGDQYLDDIKADKEKMRELIRNERRIELCFEGFRFYDMRRWKLSLNETAKGVNSQDGYSVMNVDTRNYADYMYYGPIPYTDILKFSALTQNQGW